MAELPSDVPEEHPDDREAEWNGWTEWEPDAARNLAKAGECSQAPEWQADDAWREGAWSSSGESLRYRGRPSSCCGTYSDTDDDDLHPHGREEASEEHFTLWDAFLSGLLLGGAIASVMWYWLDGCC